MLTEEAADNGRDETDRGVDARGDGKRYRQRKGQRLGEWSSKYGSSATRVKRYAAKGVRYYPKLGVGEFLMEAGELHPGDEIVITGTDTGAIIMTAGELRLDYDPVDVVKKGQHFSLKVPRRIRPSDRLYLWLPTTEKEN